MTGESSKFVLVVDSNEVDEEFAERLNTLAGAAGRDHRIHIALPGQPAGTAPAVVELFEAAPPRLHDWATAVGGSEESIECYRVSADLRWTRPGCTIPVDGGVSFICRVQRAQGMDAGGFVRHWTEVHRHLAIEHHAGMLGYVQNVVREQRAPHGGSAVDGIAELVFATSDSLDADLFPTQESRRIISDDVARFVGATRDGLYRLLQ